jgi:magnesium chelatase subunit I
VRLSVANYEVLSAAAARRALRAGERDAVPRVSDLDALAASTAGKIEVEALEDRADADVVQRLLKAAVLTVFKERVPGPRMADIVLSFDESTVLHTGDDVPSADYVSALELLPALKQVVVELTDGAESPALLASAVEFVLEGLHLSKRLNKDSIGPRATYTSR